MTNKTIKTKAILSFSYNTMGHIIGNIQFCSLGAKGLYIDICCLYWQRKCLLTKTQLMKVFKEALFVNELVEGKLIKFNGDKVVIEFLDKQFDSFTKTSILHSINGKMGAEIKKVKQTAKNIKRNI